ncbi:hypothetical protein VNO78_25286 [Psophocarpus tetragonolobus]|uniref:Uncharacterized protein n=1 Tax=Psophocarpus tetragonolobus TaxID=3891 RepID=A0AAN9S5N0_PSOTE
MKRKCRPRRETCVYSSLMPTTHGETIRVHFASRRSIYGFSEANKQILGAWDAFFKLKVSFSLDGEDESLGRHVGGTLVNRNVTTKRCCFQIHT